MNFPILTYLLAIPFAGGVLILLLPKQNVRLVRWSGFVVSLATFILSVFLYGAFDESITGFQFVQHSVWIEGLNIAYFVGVDGISILLVLLTTFLTPIALLSSWESIHHRLKEFTAMMLLLEVGMLGVFVALDTVLFYFFWEAMLIPMYFVIGIWGGEDRIYAAVKFFLFTMFGSVLMLVAILWVGLYVGQQVGTTFSANLQDWYEIAPTIPAVIQTWMFLAFALSFAIKVPMFPLHTWLPDAHVEAPTAGSVILAGVLLKMGTYGFLRFCIPLFPVATLQFLPYMAVLAVVGIIYGALVSMVQPDMKKLVAYSSVSHLGFVVLGIFALTEEALQGAIIQMVNHGLSTGALFIIVGMIYDRRHTRLIAEFGGLAKIMPVYATFFMIVSLSSIGLPGLNGFIGEFLILLGSFRSEFFDAPAYAIAAASGVILAAVYLLWMYQRVMFGSVVKPANAELRDLSKREWLVLVPIVVCIVWIGVYPSTFLASTASASKRIVQMMEDAKRFNKGVALVPSQKPGGDHPAEESE